MGAEGEMRLSSRWRTVTISRAAPPLSVVACSETSKTARARRSQLTVHVFGDGLRERLDAARKIPGILLDMETQLFGAVHLRLHLQLKLCGKKNTQGEKMKTG